MIATASPRSSERIRLAGADEVIDHTTVEVSQAVTEPVDLLLSLAPDNPEQLQPWLLSYAQAESW